MKINSIPNNWRMTNLESISYQENYGLVDGPFGSNLPASTYVSTGIPVIRGSNLSLGNTRFREEEFVFVTEETAQRLERSLCSHNDIIFTKKGTLGQIGIIPEKSRYAKYLLSSNQMKLSVDPKIANPLFVYYYLSSSASREKIVRDSEATGVPKTNLAYIRTFPILLPPLPEQIAIAYIFNALDDKIELNRQVNETLKAMAKAIFKSWFVDFDPVRAKMEYREAYGMDAETATLFPSSFDSSILGEIPRGWKVSTVGEVVEFAYGKALKEEVRYPGPIPVFGSNGQIGWHNEALVSGPGIVIGRKGNPGTVIWVNKDFFSIDTTFYVVPKNQMHALRYLYYTLSSLNLASLGADSAVPGLNRNIAYMTTILVPSIDTANLFDKTIAPIFDKISVSDEESRNLFDVRDALLSKLLSGEIRVKDAEKLLDDYPSSREITKWPL